MGYITERIKQKKKGENIRYQKSHTIDYPDSLRSRPKPTHHHCTSMCSLYRMSSNPRYRKSSLKIKHPSLSYLKSSDVYDQRMFACYGMVSTKRKRRICSCAHIATSAPRYPAHLILEEVFITQVGVNGLIPDLGAR